MKRKRILLVLLLVTSSQSFVGISHPDLVAVVTGPLQKTLVTLQKTRKNTNTNFTLIFLPGVQCHSLYSSHEHSLTCSRLVLPDKCP